MDHLARSCLACLVPARIMSRPKNQWEVVVEELELREVLDTSGGADSIDKRTT
jgi:hypothetical protein